MVVVKLECWRGAPPTPAPPSRLKPERSYYIIYIGSLLSVDQCVQDYGSRLCCEDIQLKDLENLFDHLYVSSGTGDSNHAEQVPRDADSNVEYNDDCLLQTLRKWVESILKKPVVGLLDYDTLMRDESARAPANSFKDLVQLHKEGQLKPKVNIQYI